MSLGGTWAKKSIQPLSVWVVWFFLLGSYLFLPFALRSHYASPDETTYAVITQRFVHGQTGSIADPEALTFPWLHPRSFMTMKAGIVPVGFLGVPGLFVSFFGFVPALFLPIFASILIVSSALAWYLLLKPRFGHWPALVAMVVCFAFPTWLYYGNRSLFANGIQLAFFLWSLCFLDQLPFGQRVKSLFFGLMAGLCLAMRPFELIWMLPVWIWWVKEHRESTNLVWCLVGVIVGCLPSIMLALFLYGSPFVFGYWLPGNPMPMDIAAPNSAAMSIPFLPHVLPYGIHPRTIWWNVKGFVIEMLWPWVLLAGISCVVLVRDTRHRINWILIGLIAWTGLVLVTVYGSGVYQDHVRLGAVTIGNSFLRYLMPLTLVVSLLAAALVRSVGMEGRWRKMGVGFFVVLFVALGGWIAFAKDDEGLISVRRELFRYDTIALDTSAWFPSGSVILSPRSDKVFFPQYRAVSPLPSREEVVRYLRTTDSAIGYFDRTLTADQIQAWLDLGVHVEGLKTFGNESLYRLSLLP